MSHPPVAVTFKSWLWEARRELEKAAIESPYLSAQLILEHVTGLSRSAILAHPEHCLEESQKDLAASLLVRRLQHEPMAYLLGWKEFRNLRLKIPPGVLIPRPETEELIDLAARLAPEAKRILDAGTGSGCIPLSLAEVFPQALLLGCDLSLTTLQCAKGNDLRGRVSWFQSSWLECVESKSLDMVISNPPYLTLAEIASLDPQVKLHEPLLALDGGVDGCDCYHLLTPQAARVLRIGGVLLLESSPATALKVMAICRDNGFAEVHLHLDLAGRERFVSGIRH